MTRLRVILLGIIAANSWVVAAVLLAGCEIQTQQAGPPSATAQADAASQALPATSEPLQVPPSTLPTGVSPTQPVQVAPHTPTVRPPTRTPTLTPTRTATPTPAHTFTPTPAPTLTVATIPTPALLAVPWDDRSVFRQGLIGREQQVLAELPGASVYHLDVQIVAGSLDLQGHQEVRYTNQEDQPLQELYFRLFPNLADGVMTVFAVSVNGVSVKPAYELQQSAMRIVLLEALLPGRQVVISIDFAVKTPNGEGGNYGAFAFAEGVLALAHFYPMIAVYDDEGWNVEIAPYLGDVVYADMSFYLAQVTAPLSLTVAASGIKISQENTPTEQILTFAAGPMRDFYLAASDRYTVTSRTVGQTLVNSYAPAELASGAEVALDYAEAALQSFDERFGLYPYTEFDMVSTTTFALGVEYPGIVAMLLDLYREDDSGRAGSPLFEGVAAHEVAHQWFYNIVGNDQVDEPWLDEALAQYATLLYYMDVYGSSGAAGFRQSLERRWQRVERADIPIGLPVRAYDETSYGAIVYGRGPLFMLLLAETMGQETFDAFLRDYYQTHKWGIATGADFKELAERHCACDLTPLFEAWVDEK